MGQTPIPNQGQQQVIFDNGMSLAKAPEKQFIELVKNLLQQYRVFCTPNMPMYSCSNLTDSTYEKLPSLQFTLVSLQNEHRHFEMPKNSYMKRDGIDQGWLMITPWDFDGLGGKQGEEYWALGAQFL